MVVFLDDGGGGGFLVLTAAPGSLREGGGEKRRMEEKEVGFEGGEFIWKWLECTAINYVKKEKENTVDPKQSFNLLYQKKKKNRVLTLEQFPAKPFFYY